MFPVNSDICDQTHLEHRLTQVKVNTAAGLRTRPIPIKPQAILLRLRKRALDGERASTMSIVVHKVHKCRRLVRHVVLYQLSDG